MKNIFLYLAILLSLSCTSAYLHAQSIYSYTVKTKSNEKDRTKILDILRAKLYEVHKQEFIFVVNKLNVSSNGYAWFEGTVQRKDGKQVITEDYEDCCHVEAFLKKSEGKWYIVESSAFSTDVWYDGIWDRYSAPKAIFFNE